MGWLALHSQWNLVNNTHYQCRRIVIGWSTPMILSASCNWAVGTHCSLQHTWIINTYSQSVLPISVWLDGPQHSFSMELLVVNTHSQWNCVLVLVSTPIPSVQQYDTNWVSAGGHPLSAEVSRRAREAQTKILVFVPCPHIHSTTMLMSLTTHQQE